jgi:hypothetical protein
VRDRPEADHCHREIIGQVSALPAQENGDMIILSWTELGEGGPMDLG